MLTTRAYRAGFMDGFGCMGFPKIRGSLYWSPRNMDHSLWGFILGSLYFGKVLYHKPALLTKMDLSEFRCTIPGGIGLDDLAAS